MNHSKRRLKESQENAKEELAEVKSKLDNEEPIEEWDSKLSRFFDTIAELQSNIDDVIDKIPD